MTRRTDRDDAAHFPAIGCFDPHCVRPQHYPPNPLGYVEQFADVDSAWKPGPPLTAEQERELHKRNSERQERYKAARLRQEAQTRAEWKLTVGKLKTVIAELPDDMPVVVWGELGIIDPEPTVDRDPYEIVGPVLDMGGGY